MADHSIIVELGANISNLTNNLRTASNTLSDFGSRTQQLGADIAKGFGAVGLSIGAGLGYAVKQSADFDSAMRKAGAIAGANTAEFDAMKQSAIELGANTSKSASEVAVAMTELAAKGFDANQVIAAMPGVISAAEASGEDLAMTSDTVSSALNIWGLEASEASRVADVLAESANSTAAGIEDMQYAFKYAGSPAAALGVSMEELAGAVGLMTNAGLKGENAGTALRASLLALLNPSEKNSKMMESMGIAITDAKGNFVGLSGLVDNISKSMEGMTDTQKAATLASLVGTEAVSGFLALMEAGPDKIDEMTASLEGSEGASKKSADQMKAGIGGALEELSGAIDSLVITIGDQLAPAVQTVAEWLSKLLNWFTNLPEGMKQFLVITTAVIGGITLLAAGLGVLLGFVGLVSSGVGSLAILFGTTSTVILTTIGTIFGVVTAIIAVTIAIISAYKNVEGFRNVVDSSWAWILNATKKLGPGIQAVFGATVDWIVRKFGELKGLVVIIGGFIAQVTSVVGEKFADIGSAIGGAASGVFGSFVAKASEFLSAVKALFTGDAEALVPIITTLAPTIIGLLIGGIPGLLISASRFLPAIADGMESGTPKIVEVINNVVSVIIDFLQNSLPNLIQMGLEIILNLINGILASLPTLINVAVTIISTLIETLATLIPQLLTMGIQLLTTLLEGLVSAIPLIVEAIILVIDSLTNVLLSNLPTIMDAGVNILTALIEGISTALPMLLGMAVLLITEIATGLLQSLPKILDAGMKILMALISGILQILPQLIATALTLIVKIVSVLIANLPKIISSGVKILVALINGIVSILPQLIATALKLIVQIATILIQNLPKILSAGKDILLALIKGIISIVGTLGKAIFTKVIPAIVDKLKSIDMLSIGKDIINGLLKGITSMTGALKEKVAGLAKLIPEGVKKLLGIHSPSREAIWLMEMFGQGMVKGLDNSMRSVKAMAHKLVDAATPSIDMSYNTPNVTSAGVLGVNHSFDDDTQATNAMSRVEQLLEQLLQKDQSLVINGREFAVATYNDYDNYGGNKIKLAERWD